MVVSTSLQRVVNGKVRVGFGLFYETVKAGTGRGEVRHIITAARLGWGIGDGHPSGGKGVPALKREPSQVRGPGDEHLAGSPGNEERRSRSGIDGDGESLADGIVAAAVVFDCHSDEG